VKNLLPQQAVIQLTNKRGSKFFTFHFSFFPHFTSGSACVVAVVVVVEFRNRSGDSNLGRRPTIRSSKTA
jgi:hypothetical protein